MTGRPLERRVKLTDRLAAKGPRKLLAIDGAESVASRWLRQYLGQQPDRSGWIVRRECVRLARHARQCLGVGGGLLARPVRGRPDGRIGAACTDDSLRVRGGSWDDIPSDLRAAARYGGPTGIRRAVNGLRLGRTLGP
jgi:hypothetical protein